VILGDPATLALTEVASGHSNDKELANLLLEGESLKPSLRGILQYSFRADGP
jgi:hypothetical protein